MGGLMKAAIRDNNPVLFFEHVLLYNLSEELPEGDYTCALDQADLVKEGTDVTILTYSRMRHHCLKAVEQLEAEGVSVELIDLISLKPFDMETISRSIRKTHRVIVVEECMKTGGIGAELIALITEHCFDDLDARPVRLSSQDIPTPYNGSLENLTIIQPHQIVEALLGDQRNQLGPDAAGLHAFLNHDHLVGLADGAADRLHVEGLEADQIDQLNAHP